MKVYITRALTESAGTHVWVYAYEPTRDEVIERVRKVEGECESFEWYLDTTCVYIDVREVIGSAR